MLGDDVRGEAEAGASRCEVMRPGRRSRSWPSMTDPHSNSSYCGVDEDRDRIGANLRLLEGTHSHRYGIEIDGDRAEQSASLGIDTLQANTLNDHRQLFTIDLYPLSGYTVSQYGIQSDDHRRADRHHEAGPG